MRGDLTISEYKEDLHEAKSTIFLQQKQLANYEKLIKKQNYKIQLLRTFIVKHHGKGQLDKVESGQPTTITTSSSSSSFTNSQSTSPRRTMPSSMKSKTTTTTTASSSASANARSTLPKNDDDDTMIRFRHGEKDMHSFFFETSEPSTQARHWETIALSLSPTDNPPAQTTSPPPHSSAVLDNDDHDHDVNITEPQLPAHFSPPSQQSVTEISSSQTSHTTDEDGSFTITATPPRQSVIISPISYTPFQQQRQQPSKWGIKSPSDRHHRVQQQQQQHQQQRNNNIDTRSSTTTFGQYQDQLYQSASSSASTTKRSLLTAIDTNQHQPRHREEDHFLKRPAPDSEFPYAEVVRKKDERAKLHGVTCACCAKYFENSPSATPKTIQDKIQKYSRHRERYKQPSTPPGFWDLEFPDSPLH